MASESAIGDKFLISEVDESSAGAINEGILSNIESWTDDSATAVNVITVNKMMVVDGVVASCMSYGADTLLVNKHLPMIYRTFPNASSKVVRQMQPYFYDTDSFVSKIKRNHMRSAFIY